MGIVVVSGRKMADMDDRESLKVVLTDPGSSFEPRKPTDLRLLDKLSNQAESGNLVSEFKQKKLDLEARKNWDLFYKRNSTRFFKDRHWTVPEFEELSELLSGKSDSSPIERKVLLEVGCGVGNFFFPLLNEKLNIFVHACDFSARAVRFVKENSLYDPEVCNAFECDVTCDDLSKDIQADSVDLASLIFVLSSIHPDKMPFAVQNVHKIMKVGGMVLLRDYGVNDHAMLRFKPRRKLSENHYVRQDGTMAYYFSTDLLRTLFVEAGFREEANKYVNRKTVNVKEGIDVDRVFVQARFRKS